MKQELNDKLIKNHPMFMRNLSHIECDDGWYHLLNTLFNLIEWQITHEVPHDLKYEIYALQVKSKFGGLRCYASNQTPYITGAIELAEALSNNTCEICGAYGGHKNIGGWITTMCEKHYNEALLK